MLFESSNVRIETDDRIATLWLDCADRAENRLTLAVLDELEAALRAVQRSACQDILVIRSAKMASFSPGYDLEQIARMTGEAERHAFAARGQQVMQLLSTLSPHTISVAVVEGECRSAGLELALACDYRLVIARAETLLSFPEKDWGLIPCWGGTQRLPRLIGLRRALEMFLLGQELSSGEAVACGLADQAFDEKQMRTQTQTFFDRLQDSPRKPALPRRISQRLRDGTALGRWTSLVRANGWLADVDNTQCPAARAVLNTVQLGYSSAADALAAERTAFTALAATTASRNAIEQARRAALPARVYPEPINPIGPPPERVGVVGGGELGAALAGWLALRGRQVVLQENSEGALELASARLDRWFQAARARGLTSEPETEQAKKNVRRTTAWNGFDRAQFVVEAVDEDLGVKRSVFHEIEQRVRPRTILATASSTIRVEAIQAELQRPGLVVGLHWLDSTLANPLVEIVHSPLTEAGTLASLDAWLRRWRKTPVLVSDRPGRLVNRIQLAYLSEAVLLVAEGLPPELIDRDMRRFGMKQGPLETIDALGFDNLAQLVENLQLARGDGFANNLLLDRMRSYGWNGRENGEGFYRYRRGRGRPNELARMVLWQDEPDEDVISHYIFDPCQALADGVERLVLRTINEAAFCLPDERDADPGLLDLALAVGAGWAPQRGGPLRHADQIGLVAVVERLLEFTERFGKRFEPCVELQRRAEAGESFYGLPVPDELPDLVEYRRLAG
jgi:3-hydroxyacyl-CoA dehydrogenase/enoyl-CoA hydratase/3-hydroxybutyryl-CoA epimerase